MIANELEVSFCRRKLLQDTRTDFELVTAYQEGNPEAFSELYGRHINYVYGTVYRFIENYSDVEDITATTFNRALDNMSRFKPRHEGAFKGWVSRIASNLARNHRTHTTYRSKNELTIYSLNIDEVGEKGESLHERVIRQQRDQELRRLLTGLPIDRMRLIAYRFVEGSSCDAIAITMGRSVSAIKALLHRTVVGLRNEIRQHPDQYSLLHEMLNEFEQRRLKTQPESNP